MRSSNLQTFLTMLRPNRLIHEAGAWKTMATMSGRIEGQEDFELKIPRTVPVTFTAEIPEDGPADGLVFLIPGFGGDRDEVFSTMVRRHIAAKYNLVAVSVRAHCHICRLGPAVDGLKAALNIDPEAVTLALGSLLLQGSTFEGLTALSPDAVLAYLKTLRPQRFELKATILPPCSDYQNFGVLAALDHLRVLYHLMDQDVSFAHDNVVCLGTSHGGYISHLIHKFAPNNISAVIDSSGYSETMPKFLGFGDFEYTQPDGNLDYLCTTRTAWTNREVGAANYFGTDEALIRDVAHPGHLQTLAVNTQARRCQFRLVHSTKDSLVDIALKRRQAKILSRFGYDVVLDEMGEGDVDGDFVTTLEHGLGIGLNKLFDRYYPTLSLQPGITDREAETSLEFEGIHKSYRVEHRGKSGDEAASLSASISIK
ncbi:MAG: hypothetical protein COA62_01695 [Rhodobiaceae bacterium]|nr:MAG: hypothetical protein COA62_01695 [Rhodobiaceae bacterium]